MASMYPAIKASMGRWTYYIVKIKVSDLAKEVSLSSDVHQDKTLDEAIQRVVHESRARQDLVVYLHDREDRFLNSIVVAALGGAPTFTSLQLADTPENTVFRAMQLDQSFGVLTFAGGEKYYALDGQHRLAAIRAILEPTDATRDRFAREYVSEEFRQTFREEEISVIMVVQDPGEDASVRDEMLKDYRRLFSSLNRYAKATDPHTNIIMDENDGIALLTRRLIAEHEFFKWTVENPSEYSIVKTGKGKSLKATDSYFTQIEVLYDINYALLACSSRSARGWKLNERETIPQKDFKKIWRIRRPDDDVLDDYYEELSDIWDGILETLPELRRSPVEMRVHNPSEDQDQEEVATHDHVLFWPIGQYVFADIVRELLDDFSTQVGRDTLQKGQVAEALKPLKRVEWSLHKEPWRHLLLVKTTDRRGIESWKMRNEDRTLAIYVSQEVLEFIVGITPLEEQGQDDLRRRWTNRLVPIPEEGDANEMWQAIVEQAISDQ